MANIVHREENHESPHTRIGVIGDKVNTCFSLVSLRQTVSPSKRSYLEVKGQETTVSTEYDTWERCPPLRGTGC